MWNHGFFYLMKYNPLLSLLILMLKLSHICPVEVLESVRNTIIILRLLFYILSQKDAKDMLHNPHSGFRHLYKDHSSFIEERCLETKIWVPWLLFATRVLLGFSQVHSVQKVRQCICVHTHTCTKAHRCFFYVYLCILKTSLHTNTSTNLIP